MNSYDNIVNKMKDKYEELTGGQVSNESDIMMRFKVLATQLLNMENAVEFVKRQMFVSTAEGEYLDMHASERGLTRKDSVKARGEVTFSLSFPSASDIVIEKGTVVATSGVDFKSFETTKDVVILAGKLEVSVPVVAVKGGSDHNVKKDAICVMVTPPMGVDKVTNKLQTKSGADKESDEDLRARTLDSYKDISNSTNAVYYKRLAQSVGGIHSASVQAGVDGAGTLALYLRAKGDAQLSMERIEEVQQLIDKNRELCVDTYVYYAVPKNFSLNLSLELYDSYEFSVVSEKVREKLYEYIDSLEVGQPALMCEMNEALYHIEGVKNFHFNGNTAGDITVNTNQYCVLENLEIGQVS